MNASSGTPGDHDHDHPHAPDEPSKTPLDAGSRALEEALRSSFVIVKIVMALLLILFICSGIRAVGPQEKAVILRFGKPLSVGPEKLLGPGFHWAFPYPIDEVVTIEVGQIQTITSTVGWYGTTAVAAAVGVEPPPGPSLNPASDGYALTGDTNIIHARATLRYRITDPIAYTFNFLNGSNIVLNVLNHAIINAAARSTVDEALLKNAEFKEKVLTRVNQQIEALKLGITLDPSDVTVIAPRQVQPEFDAVLNAEQDRSTVVSAAQGQAESTVRQAEAEANALINTAEAERVRLVQTVQADAKSFSVRLPEYQLNPDLSRQRLLTETWERILATAQDKFYLPDRPDGKSRELRLLLNREPMKPSTEK